MYEIVLEVKKVTVSVQLKSSSQFVPLFTVPVQYVWSNYYTGNCQRLNTYSSSGESIFSLSGTTVYAVRQQIFRPKHFTVIHIGDGKYLFIGTNIYVFELDKDSQVEDFGTPSYPCADREPYFVVKNPMGEVIYYMLDSYEKPTKTKQTETT